MLTKYDPAPQVMVEICDNAIDDDGDGLIDLNDPDCNCQFMAPISLIPNPSFEEYECCPTQIGKLTCADTWIQASAATTDYINQCGTYFGPFGKRPPLPYPDGMACIGFRNGILAQPQIKEYAGACLVDTVYANQQYTFNFSVGFTDSDLSPPINIVIYGSSNCGNLPIGDPAPSYGCPLGSGDWVVLAEKMVSGDNEWVNVNVNFFTEDHLTAVAIGPDCAMLSSDSENYYYFDNLTLFRTSDFLVEIDSIRGHQCSSDYLVGSEEAIEAGSTVQWYLDGVAILGANEKTYLVPREATGELVMVLYSRFGCIFSNTIAVENHTIHTSPHKTYRLCPDTHLQ